ncbi:MAG TPA: alpha/beta fold hydrolase [candidate division Zixibacteria bacterium]|nr:alpha/beta fold hydrolase [candidate division Zixibacteria bacterium]
MPYISNHEGIKLYLDEYLPDEPDDRPPLVFLHGFTLDRRMWREQGEFFKKTRRVIVPDARGHGESDRPVTGYSRDDRAADLLDLLDALHIEKCHLIGLSMGGSTAIGFALKHQERLASLTLVSSGAAGYAVGRKISRVDEIAREKGIEAAREKWVQVTLAYYKDDKKALSGRIEQMMRDHSGAIWADPKRGQYPSSDDLANVHKIKVPTAIFTGELDRIFIKLSRLLAEQIKGADLHVYEGVGHMVNMEAPERFNRDLSTFLDRAERV